MDIKAADRLSGIGTYYFAQKLQDIAHMRAKGLDIINLGIGSPDMPPHRDVITSMTTQAQQSDVHGYQPYKGITPLRAAWASWYQRWFNVHLDPESQILPLIGSKEGIMHISMALLNSGDQVLVPDPGYPTYQACTKLAGGDPIIYSLNADNRWMPDLDLLGKVDLSKVKMMWLSYPHMPTGAKADKGFMRDIVTFAKDHKIILCHDHPYVFIQNDEAHSLLEVPGSMEVSVEFNSLSKAYNMAGWRIGAVCGNPAIITEILRFKSNMDSGMYLPLQAAAITALALGNDWFTSLNQIYSARRQKINELMDELGCTYMPEQAGLFVWARVPKGSSGDHISDLVLQHAHVFITPGQIFGSQGDQYIRASLCTTIPSITEAIKRIRQHKRSITKAMVI